MSVAQIWFNATRTEAAIRYDPSRLNKGVPPTQAINTAMKTLADAPDIIGPYIYEVWNPDGDLIGIVLGSPFGAESNEDIRAEFDFIIQSAQLLNEQTDDEYGPVEVKL
jgi:hypothetical protein